MDKRKLKGKNWYVTYYYVKSKDFMPDLKLPVSAKDLLLLIDTLDRGKDHCFAGIGTLADAIGVDRTTIQGGLNKLKAAGLISVSEKKINGRWRYTSHLLPEDKNCLVDGNLLDISPAEEGTNQLLPVEVPAEEGTNRLDTAHIININKNDNIIKNKKNINFILHPKAKTMLRKMKKSIREEIEDIYQFWNECNNTGTWHSHRKLTPDMVKAIVDNLEKYTLEDMCTAIHNYALVLQGDKYWWDYVWPLSAFLSVKDGNAKDAYKKWYKFLPENFVETNYIKKENGNGFQYSKPQQEEKLLDDPRPDITEKVVKQYKWFVGKGYKLTNIDHNKFIETTKILLEKLGSDPTEFRVDSLLDDLITVLREHYTNKGGVVHPGSFCSEATWVKYMPQYFKNIPQVKLYDYDEQATKEFDDIVAEEEQLTKDIERNMRKQNPEPDKPVGDTDNPELDYMLGI